MNNTNQEIKLIDRNSLTVSGVIKVLSFNQNQFVLDTNLGPLDIRGAKMELLSLDNSSNIIKINGIISSVNYIEKIRKNEESFLAKLFK